MAALVVEQAGQALVAMVVLVQLPQHRVLQTKAGVVAARLAALLVQAVQAMLL
jgi:hypothetical protein